jgi:CRISPR-associated protein Cas2
VLATDNRNVRVMGKKKKEPTFFEKLQKIKKAGLEGSPPIGSQNSTNELEPLDQRVQQILGIVKNFENKPGKMIYFVMYDIENNKVRAQVVKYLIKKGCSRVQKSIFLANTKREVFDEIRNDLREVQSCYENNDSIFVVPISTDEIKAMSVIGQKIDFDLILQNRNTLFF